MPQNTPLCPKNSASKVLFGSSNTLRASNLRLSVQSIGESGLTAADNNKVKRINNRINPINEKAFSFLLLINFSNDISAFNLTPIAYQPQKPPKGILPFVAILLGIRTTLPLRRHAAKVRSIPQTMLSKSLHKATRAHVWIENRKTIQPLDFNIHFLHFTTISVIGQRFLTPKQSFNNEIKRKPLDLKCTPNIMNIAKRKPSQTFLGSTGSILVRRKQPQLNTSIKTVFC